MRHDEEHVYYMSSRDKVMLRICLGESEKETKVMHETKEMCSMCGVREMLPGSKSKLCANCMQKKYGTPPLRDLEPKKVETKTIEVTFDQLTTLTDLVSDGIEMTYETGSPSEDQDAIEEELVEMWEEWNQELQKKSPISKRVEKILKLLYLYNIRHMSDTHWLDSTEKRALAEKINALSNE